VIFWNTFDALTGKTEPVEAFHSLEDAIKDMTLLAWDSPTNRWSDVLVDENTGEVVAVAVFGPELELIIACADGRLLRFERPETYKE
jgi:hypothetical protein